MNSRVLASVLTGFLVMAGAHAHHSFISEYDIETVTELTGSVTEVWFKNPHTRVYIETSDEQGTKTLWELETYPRNLLHRRGWKHDDLKIGDVVVVTGRRARDGGNRLQLLTMVRPSDGWEGIGFDPDSID